MVADKILCIKQNLSIALSSSVFNVSVNFAERDSATPKRVSHSLRRDLWNFKKTEQAYRLLAMLQRTVLFPGRFIVEALNRQLAARELAGPHKIRIHARAYVTTSTMPHKSTRASISASDPCAPQDFPLDGASRVSNKSSRGPIKDAHDDDLYPRARNVRVCVCVCMHVALFKIHKNNHHLRD